ncbi:hypothetical protein Leryth_015729 [Lithospermum erythrorhizon]|nr:hypothetical protein Leryth_015729 [Lithospermum erythrorhizon]
MRSQQTAWPRLLRPGVDSQARLPPTKSVTTRALMEDLHNGTSSSSSPCPLIGLHPKINPHHKDNSPFHHHLRQMGIQSSSYEYTSVFKLSYFSHVSSITSPFFVCAEGVSY